MLINNEKDIKKEIVSAHNGKGLMGIRFAFKQHQHYGNKNDAKWNCFAIAELPIGATAGNHKHQDTDEIFYILQGEAKIKIDNETQKIKKGDIILTRLEAAIQFIM
jgi:quercetin dioxygenase-like cupin family protein